MRLSEMRLQESTPLWIKGLYVKDYHDLHLDALEEIIQLDEQLDNNLVQLYNMLEEEDYYRLKYNLDCLIVDNRAAIDYAKKCQEDILADMEHTQKHFEDYMNKPEE